MSAKRRTKKRTSDYEPAFTAAEHKLMQKYGVCELMDEIWLNRVKLLRTADKRNSADGWACTLHYAEYSFLLRSSMFFYSKIP